MTISNISYKDVNVPGQALVTCTAGSSGDYFDFKYGKIKAVSVVPTSESGTDNVHATFSGQTITISGDQINNTGVNLHVYYYL